jgi:hypothetical protein
VSPRAQHRVGHGDTIMCGASQHVDTPSAYIHPG